MTLLKVHINPEWEKIAGQVLKPGRSAIVIGRIDTGKTTLCKYLTSEGIRRGLKVGIVDADVGQSWIGPPTTIGMKVISSQPYDFEADEFYFVGAISPEKAFIDCVVGAKLITDAAKERGAELIIIDTTGYVDGPSGRTLKKAKIQLINPTDIILIQRERELEQLRKSLSGDSRHIIHLLKPSQVVSRKSKEARKRYRDGQLIKYFADSPLCHIPSSQLHVINLPLFYGRKATKKELENLSNLAGEMTLYAEFTYRALTLISADKLGDFALLQLSSQLKLDEVFAYTPDDFDHSIAAVLDDEAKTLSLAIVEKVDFESQSFQVRCQCEIQRIKAIRFSKLKLTVSPLQTSY